MGGLLEDYELRRWNVVHQSTDKWNPPAKMSSSPTMTSVGTFDPVLGERMHRNW